MDENREFAQPEEDEGIDIMALLRQLWDGRKLIIIITGIFIVLGLVAALTMKRTYTVNSVMVPQMNSKSNSQLSTLAALAGMDMGMDLTAKDLSPLVYPQIVNSVPFRRELLYTPLHYSKADSAVSTYTYYKDIVKPSVFSIIKKYTIGLPFTILAALQKEKPEIVLPAGEGAGDDAPKPVVLSKAEAKMIKMMGESVTLNVDKKEGTLTLTVVGIEPIQTAELALAAQNLLQTEITRFRTEKAARDLAYIQGRYDECKREAESLQSQLATARDRAQGVVGTSSNLQRERIQQRYNVANAVYTDMAKQLEQAKLQVKRDTPVLAIVQPVTVPMKPSNSRAKTLVIWTFLGFVLACGWVLAKGYWPKLKEKFEGKEE